MNTKLCQKQNQLILYNIIKYFTIKMNYIAINFSIVP